MERLSTKGSFSHEKTLAPEAPDDMKRVPRQRLQMLLFNEAMA